MIAQDADKVNIIISVIANIQKISIYVHCEMNALNN